MNPESQAPVMDVSAPPAPPKVNEPALAVAPPETKSEPETKQAAEPKPESKEKDKSKAKVESKVIQPKKSNGVTAAIVATVFIVFGLAALATYAYFKSTS